MGKLGRGDFQWHGAAGRRSIGVSGRDFERVWPGKNWIWGKRGARIRHIIILGRRSKLQLLAVTGDGGGGGAAGTDEMRQEWSN